MARVLIVGCGCRGTHLARDLMRDGHAVRGTTRDPDRARELEAAGIEPWIGDPDRIGSLVYAMENVTVLCWLLGSAAGEPDQIAALHGPRLTMLFEKVVDTTVRGVLYETAGTVDRSVLEGGRRIAEHAQETWEIPVGFLQADPIGPIDDWVSRAREGIEAVLAVDRAALARGEEPPLR